MTTDRTDAVAATADVREAAISAVVDEWEAAFGWKADQYDPAAAVAVDALIAAGFISGETPATATGEDVRRVVLSALDESVDRCARCKVCDVQADAVVAALDRSRTSPVAAALVVGDTTAATGGCDFPGCGHPWDMHDQGGCWFEGCPCDHRPPVADSGMTEDAATTTAPAGCPESHGRSCRPEMHAATTTTATAGRCNETWHVKGAWQEGDVRCAEPAGHDGVHRGYFDSDVWRKPNDAPPVAAVSDTTTTGADNP